MEHLEMYGFLLPITRLKECNLIPMVVSPLQEITSLAMVNSHTLTKRFASQGTVLHSSLLNI